MADLYREIKSSLFRGMEEAGLNFDAEVELRFKRQLLARKRPLTMPSYLNGGVLTGDVPLDFEEISKTVFAYGSLISEAFCWTAGMNTKETKYASRLGGWLNLGISLYDFLLDEVPTLSTTITRSLTEKRLEEWIETGNVPRCPSKHPVITLLWEAISNVIDGFRSRGLQDDHVVWSEITGVLLAMHAGESYVSNACLSHTLGKSRKYLLAKSALPFWAMAILVTGDRVVEKMSDWKKFSLSLGELYALVDDGVDISVDIKNGRMNLIALEVARKRPEWFKNDINVSYRLELLRIYLSQSDLISSWAKRLCTNLQVHLNCIQEDRKIRKYVVERVKGSVTTWYG